MTNLTPLPELRVEKTSPALDEISPEAATGRFEHRTKATADRPIPVFEQEWHILAAKCLALRMTHEDTAKFCGVLPNQVGAALRAPFFQARLREELNKTTTPLEELFRDAGVSAFHKIVSIMEDPKTPKATALASAKEIIDRCLGKAPQTIKHEENDSVSDPVALVAMLKEQNAGLRSSLPN